jgi:hypothetical protein
VEEEEDLTLRQSGDEEGGIDPDVLSLLLDDQGKPRKKGDINLLEVLQTFSRASKKAQRERDAEWEKVSDFVSVIKRY